MSTQEQLITVGRIFVTRKESLDNIIPSLVTSCRLRLHYQHAQSEIKHPNSSKAPSPFTLTINEPKTKTQKIK